MRVVEAVEEAENVEEEAEGIGLGVGLRLVLGLMIVQGCHQRGS